MPCARIIEKKCTEEHKAHKDEEKEPGANLLPHYRDRKCEVQQNTTDKKDNHRGIMCFLGHGGQDEKGHDQEKYPGEDGDAFFCKLKVFHSIKAQPTGFLV